MPHFNLEKCTVREFIIHINTACIEMSVDVTQVNAFLNNPAICNIDDVWADDVFARGKSNTCN